MPPDDSNVNKIINQQQLNSLNTFNANNSLIENTKSDLPSLNPNPFGNDIDQNKTLIQSQNNQNNANLMPIQQNTTEQT